MPVNTYRLLPLTAAIGTMLAGPALAQTSDSAQTMEVIVVSADPLRRSADVISQPVTVLTEADLKLRPITNVGELLDGLPGIANSDFGPGVGRPVIRGLQGSRVRTLEDGLPTADVAGEGADHAIAIDPARARQVEVYRGPATLLYGNGAVGGVVNVRTDRFSPDIAGGPRARGALTYGENGNDRQGYVGVELPAAENFALRADASRRRTGDFDIDGFQQVGQTGGRRDRLVNSSVETDSLSLSGTFRGDWGYLGLGVSSWETDYGIPKNFDARPRALGGQSDHFERVAASYDRFDMRGELLEPLQGFRTARFAMAYTQFEQQEAEFEFNRTPAGGEFDEKTVEAEFSNDEFELRLEMEHHQIGDWSGVIGLQVNDRKFGSNDPRGLDRNVYVRPNITSNKALFLLEEREIPLGRIEFSARLEHQRSRPDDVQLSRVEGITRPDSSFTDFPNAIGNRGMTTLSVATGAIFDISPEHHLTFHVTRAERAPAPEQMFAFGRHAAAGTFEIGDPTLDKEAHLNFEVGIDRHVGTFRYETRAFYNRINNFTFLGSVDDGTGSPIFVNDVGNRAGEGATIGCAPGGGGLCRLRNQLVFNEQVDAEFFGAEGSAVAEIITGPQTLSLRVSGDHVRGKVLGGGNLPRMTPTRAGVGLDATSGDFSLSADYRRVFKQENIGRLEAETGGFNLVSLNLSWTPPVLAGGELFLAGRNLLNERGRLHQSFFRDNAPIIGRAFFAGLRFDLGV